MSLHGLNILLAEDNPTNQMVAVQMLESLGATVTLAVDGAEALEILEHSSFDVALIDIEMPRISGIDLIRRLRAPSSELSGMPLIALTAYVMREHRAAIDEAGADGIIAKPILSIDQFGQDILGYMKLRNGLAGRVDAKTTGSVVATQNGAEIDRDIFDRLWSSFDDAGRAELGGKIVQDISAAQSEIKKSLASNDMKAICDATHILMSVAGAIGAVRLQNLSQCLNSAGHASDSDAIGRDGPELVAEAGHVLDFVRDSLGE